MVAYFVKSFSQKYWNAKFGIFTGFPKKIDFFEFSLAPFQI
jgi:hypothetical protein